MKNTFVSILVGGIILSMTACGGTDSNENITSTTNEESITETTQESTQETEADVSVSDDVIVEPVEDKI